MKLFTKIKATLYALSAGIFVIAVLLVCTASGNSKTLDAYYKDYIRADNYKNIYVYDCNGEGIYKGAFSDDEVLRTATFHIIGDRFGSVPNSVLSTENSKPQEVSKLTGYAPKTNIIYLTIDNRMQKGAYEILAKGDYKGCIIVSDYTTGEIKTMVSYPSVDVFTPENAKDGAFLNKAAITYPPGSVFKAVTVAAILEKDASAKDFSYNCSGKAYHISCYHNIPHYQQPFSKVLSNSCNCGISTAAKKYLTPTELNNFAKKSGVLSNEVIADMSIAKGSMDANDDLMWAANGQSKNMVTPLGVVAYYNAIANGGLRHTLYIKSDTETGEAERIMSKATAEFISKSLENVTKSLGINCKTFAKTGTAELDNAQSHAWFACCINDSNAPAYTVLVLLENGGISTNAKAITKAFINNYILD